MTKVPLRVGDEMELNDHRAIVVGICRNSRTWQSQPIVYTTYTRATTFAPAGAEAAQSFVLVKGPRRGRTWPRCASGSTSETGLAAYDRAGSSPTRRTTTS